MADLRNPVPDGSLQVLIAIHDVTPAHDAAVSRILSLLDELALKSYALLVVPDWHGEWPLARHAAFTDQLVRRRAAGAEIFLHGLRHDEADRRRTPLQRVLVAGRTRASAEFRFLARDEVCRRLDAGIAALDRAGLPPVGFVPPAWLPAPASRPLLHERGLRITEGFWTIERVADGRRWFAPALSWSTRRAWRSVACAGIAAARGVIEARRKIVRIAIHPPDIGVPVVARSLRRTLMSLTAERTMTSYAAFTSDS